MDKPQGPSHAKYLEWVGEVKQFNNREKSEVDKLLKDTNTKWKLLGVFPVTVLRGDGSGYGEEFHYVLGRERE